MLREYQYYLINILALHLSKFPCFPVQTLYSTQGGGSWGAKSKIAVHGWWGILMQMKDSKILEIFDRERVY